MKCQVSAVRMIWFALGWFAAFAVVYAKAQLPQTQQGVELSLHNASQSLHVSQSERVVVFVDIYNKKARVRILEGVDVSRDNGTGMIGWGVMGKWGGHVRPGMVADGRQKWGGELLPAKGDKIKLELSN